MYADENYEDMGGEENLVDNDEIDTAEEGFMKGFEEDRQATAEKGAGDKAYDDAFEKKSRRSKRNQESFDEEDIEAEVVLR